MYEELNAHITIGNDVVNVNGVVMEEAQILAASVGITLHSYIVDAIENYNDIRLKLPETSEQISRRRHRHEEMCKRLLTRARTLREHGVGS